MAQPHHAHTQHPVAAPVTAPVTALAVVADDGPTPATRTNMRRSALLGLAGVLASAFAVFAIIHLVGPERLQELVQAAGPFAPVAFVLLKASTVVVTPLSGTPLRFAAGALFGFWPGVALSVCGSVLGGSINFWIARRFGRRIVVRLLGAGALARVEPMLGRLGTWRALVLARLVLAPLWDILCYGVGLTRLRFRTFLAVAVIGELLPTMLLVGVGSGMMELGLLETAQAGAEAATTNAVLLLVIAMVGIVLLLGVAAFLRPRVLRLLAGPSSRSVSRGAPRPRPLDA
jgi:uncharacterized membrane protein YdjX (TVP38/TMEM64 family)